MNLMYYFRGHKQDFDGWAELGNEGWDFDSVLPFYQQNENLTSPELLSKNTTYGTNGRVSLTQAIATDPLRNVLLAAAAEKGYPHLDYEGAGDSLGYLDSVGNIGNGVRQNTGRVFLGNARNRSNLIIALGAQAEKIVIDDNNNATGVVVTINNKTLNIQATKEVIVSAGVVNTPRLLKLSGIGNREELERFGIPFIQDLAVGENYQDHVAVEGYLVKVEPGLVNPTSGDAYTVIGGIPTYCLNRDGPLASIGFASFVAFINTYNNSQYPNIQVFHFLFPKGTVKLFTMLQAAKFNPAIIAAAQAAVLESDVLMIVTSLSHPKSRGQVNLTSGNFQDSPAVYWNPYDQPDDLETHLSAIKYLEGFLQTEAFSQYNPELVRLPLPACDIFLYRSDDYFRCLIRHTTVSLLHLAGTAKMGPPNDTQAVVDNRLRVYGIGNLRVIDNSIIPRITTGNTNGPAIMIGRKGATIVTEDWSS